MDRREQEMKRRREQERRRAQTKSMKKKRSQKVFWLVMLSLLLIGFLVLGAYTFFFPVKIITVEGNERYSTSDIINASGIATGDNLLSLNPEEIEISIRSACPYIHDVTIERKLPKQVIVRVVEGDPLLAFYQNGEYFLVNQEYELMEVNKASMGGTVIHGFTVTSNGPAKRLTIAPNENFGLLEELVAEIQKQEITGVTQIDLSNVNKIRLLYKNRHIWELGNAEKIDYKLKFGVEISGRQPDSGIVTLSDLNTGKNGYFTPASIGEFATLTVETPTDVLGN